MEISKAEADVEASVGHKVMGGREWGCRAKAERTGPQGGDTCNGNWGRVQVYPDCLSVALSLWECLLRTAGAAG